MEVVRLEHFGRRTGLARRELGESGNDGQSTEYFDGAALIVRWTAWLLADAWLIRAQLNEPEIALE